jgi:hypothetical protein
MAEKDYRLLKKRLDSLGMGIQDFSVFSGIKKETIWMWRIEGRKVPQYIQAMLELMEHTSELPRKLPIERSTEYADLKQAILDAGGTPESFWGLSRIKKSTYYSWGRRKVPEYAYTFLWLLQETGAFHNGDTKGAKGLYLVKKFYIEKRRLSNEKVKEIIELFASNVSRKKAARKAKINPITMANFYQQLRIRLSELFGIYSLDENDKVMKMPLKTNTFLVIKKEDGLLTVAPAGDIDTSNFKKDYGDDIMDFANELSEYISDYRNYHPETFEQRLREQACRYHYDKKEINERLLESLENTPLQLEWQ